MRDHDKGLLAQFDEAIKQAPDWTALLADGRLCELRLRLKDGRQLACEVWRARDGRWSADVQLLANGVTIADMHGSGQTKAEAFRVAVRRLGVHH